MLFGPGGIGSGNVLNIVLGVFLLIVGINLLAMLAKFDPDAREIFRRALKYKERYSSVSGFRVMDKEHKP